MTTKNEKRRIIITKEQEEKMSAQSAQKIQAFLTELAQTQSRRCDLLGLIVSAQVTHGGVASVIVDDVEKLADVLERNNSKTKWTELRALFAEMGVEGPQPHLEWAAKQVGVRLFEAPGIIIAPPVETSEGEPIQ